jgi:hypothetical protein
MAIREELTLGLQGWKKGMDEARSDVRKLNRDIRQDMRAGGGGGIGGRIGGGIASMGTDALGALGLAGGATGLTLAIKGALSSADDLADLSLALNESAEGLQRVDFAAQQAAGVGIDQVSKSLLRLERSMGDVENAKATEALESLGLSAAKLAEMSIEEKILALSEAFQKARETGTGMADIQDLLGRTAADLVPLFEQGGDALRAMFEEAPVMAEETVQQMARVNDQIDAMVAKSKSWLANSVGGLVGLADIAKNTLGIDPDGGGIIDGIINDPLGELVDAVRGAVAFALDPAAAFDKAVQSTIETENADIQAAADRDDKRKKQADAMTKTAEDVAAAKKKEELAKQMEIFDKAEHESNRDFAKYREQEAKRKAKADDDRAKLAAEYEEVAGRMKGPAAEQGSFATLMDQIFGRGTPEQQLDEMKRANTLAADLKKELEEIRKKMDEEPPRDMWTGA